MGAGDLNLKKSWHPMLFKNQERVWKEEKKALDERKRIEQLRREREEERQMQEIQRLEEASGKTKQVNRVDWMYQAPSTETGHYSEEMEGYLLGKRRIDGILMKKTEASETNNAVTHGASTGESSDAPRPVVSQRDTMHKVLADPLLEIRKKEQAAYEATVREAVKRKEKEARRNGDKDSGHSRHKDRRHEHRSERRRYSDEGEEDRHRSHRSSHRSSRRRSRSRSPARSSANYRGDRYRGEENRHGGDRYHGDCDREDHRAHREREIDHGVDQGRADRDRKDHRDHRERETDHGVNQGREDRDRLPRRSPDRNSRYNNDRGTRRDEPRREYNNRREYGNRDREPPSRPDPKEVEAERLRKLAEMQSNASELETSRRERIADITAKEQEQKEADDRKRSDRGAFMSKVHKRVHEDSLDERIRRNRGGLSKMED